MKFQTTKHGTLDIKDDEILTIFIRGFYEGHKYALLTDKKPYMILHSLDNPALFFNVIEIKDWVEHYPIDAGRLLGIVTALSWDSNLGKVTEETVNLLGPIAINHEIGTQVLVSGQDSRFPMKKLFKQR